MAYSPIGSYSPYDSFLHRMDPRAKIAALVALMVAVFLGYANYSMTFLVAGLCFAFFAVLVWVSHSSFLRLLSSMKSLWFMAIILLLVYCLIPRSSGTLAFYIGSLAIYYESLLDAGRILLRLFLMIELTMLLTATTKPLDLTFALEWYMTPFRLIGFPSHEVAMVISLALRFIPTILEDVQRIMKAQQSRGVDFKHGSIKNRIRAYVSLIVPLFVSSFMRSEELSDAMSARAYDPQGKRTRYKALRFRAVDAVELLVALAFMGGCIAMSALSFDLFSFVGWSVL